MLLFKPNDDNGQASVQDPTPPWAKPKPPRRGTTAMEYLMMLSLIVVVALWGIGYFGSMTNQVSTATANSIQKAIKKGS